MNHLIPISDYPEYLKNASLDNITCYNDIKSYIEILKVNSRNFLIIIDKPLFFEISEKAYEFFKNLKNNNEELIDYRYTDIKIELDTLIRLGVFSKIKTNNSINVYIDNLCLLVSQTCNLSCKYCFANEGTYNENINSIMNIDIMKRSIDKYFNHNSDNPNTINIQFFGGEPLINKKLIKELLEYSELQKKNYKFKIKYGLITNGTLLDEDIKLLINKYNIQLRVSLDGNKLINDKYRVYKNSAISVYDLVIKNIEKLNLNKNNIEIVITYVDTNNNLLDSIKSLVEIGFNSFSINPLILHPNIKKSFENQNDIYTGLMNQLSSIVDYIIENSKKGKILHLEFLENNIVQLYKPKAILNIDKLRCSASYKNIVINTKGEIFPCDLFLYENKYKLGNIFNDSIESMDLFKKYNIENLQKKFINSCKKCYMRYMCKGKCPYKLLHDQDNLVENIQCKYIKYKLFLSLYFLTKVSQKYKHPFIKHWMEMKGNSYE